MKSVTEPLPRPGTTVVIQRSGEVLFLLDTVGAELFEDNPTAARTFSLRRPPTAPLCERGAHTTRDLKHGVPSAQPQSPPRSNMYTKAQINHLVPVSDKCTCSKGMGGIIVIRGGPVLVQQLR